MVDRLQGMPRRISFTHSWRKPCYIVRVGDTTVPIYRPLLVSVGFRDQFQFQLPGGDEVVVTIDSRPSIAIYVNDNVVATITPVLATSGIQFGLETYPLQVATVVATVGIGEERWPLICSVYGGIASNNFRILNRCGSRMCFWKKTGGWGTGNATLVVSQRVHSSFLPIAISATLVSLFDTPSAI